MKQKLVDPKANLRELSNSTQQANMSWQSKLCQPLVELVKVQEKVPVGAANATGDQALRSAPHNCTKANNTINEFVEYDTLEPLLAKVEDAWKEEKQGPAKVLLTL